MCRPSSRLPKCAVGWRDRAARPGCRNAHLDTYSLEVRPFYEKNDHEVFATLDGFPPGHQKRFLRKKLA